MAEKSRISSGGKSKAKIYKQGSKMRKYDQVDDTDVKQMRCGFINLLVSSNEVASSDTLWTVEAGYEYRMDLISYKFYGTAKYDWVLEQLNDIKDPMQDIYIGVKIKLPSQSRILMLL